MRAPLLCRLALALPVLLAVGCGGGDGGGGGGTGTLVLSATDAPFPATEGCLAAALVEIDGVTVQSPSGWVEIPLVDDSDGADDGVVTLDLLQLRSGLEDSLAVGELPTGTYHQIRLHIVSSVLQFVSGAPDRTFFVPSGAQSGLKINVQPPVVIAAGQETPLLLDFDLTRSFHVTANGGEPTCEDLESGPGTVHFNPVVRAMNTDETGVVAGVVEDSGGAPVAHVEVVAFPAGTVVDADTVPTATTFSAPPGLNAVDEGSYALRLDPASYDLYVRAQGEETRLLAAAAVSVSAGAITTQDLTLPAP
jgi:hypothetical protein